MARYPVFVVGSARSGTSAMVDALRSVGYNGFREGMFLTLIQKFEHLIDGHFSSFETGRKQVLIGAIDKDQFKERIFQAIRQTVEEQNPTPPWLDKTGGPQMISSIPVILRLWPQAAIIYSKRRGIENIVSRVKKFPALKFEEHCVGWAQNMKAWRRLRGTLSKDAFVEVDQQDMIKQPEAVSAQLRTLLGLSEEQEKKMAMTMTSKRPQETDAGSSSRTYSLQSANFSEEQIALFLKHCQAEMDAFGYTLDERYKAA